MDFISNVAFVVFYFYTPIGYSTILSHSRLGHISRNGIKRLINSGILSFSGRILVLHQHINMVFMDTPTKGKLVYFISFLRDCT
jgi:hypothetical protein